MADVVAKLQVDSSQFDQRLKSAVEQMSKMEKEVRRTGVTFAYADKEEMEFVKSLGSMVTKADSAKGKIAEMTKSFTELSLQYNRLTKEEKASPFGKALASSLDQLKTRIKDSKSELAGVEGRLTSFGDVAKQMGAKLGIPVEQLTKFGPYGAAAAAALKVASDAFKQNEEFMDEWGRTTEAAGTVYQGFLNALNTGDIGGFLRNIGNIISKSREAYDAMDQLGTFNAFNQIQIEGARTDFTEAMANYREGSGTKEDVKAAADRLKNEMQSRQDKEQAAYIAAIKELAASRGVDEEMLQKALSGTYGDYETLKNKELTGVETQYHANQFGVAYTTTTKVAANEEEKLGEMLRKLNDDELAHIQSLGAQAQRTATEIAQVDKQTVRVLGAGNRGSKTDATGGVTTKELNPLQEAQRKISELSTEALTADEGRMEAIRQEIEGLQAQVAEYKQIQDYVQGIKKDEAKPALQIEGPSGYSQEGISALRSEIQDAQKSMQMGSKGYMVEASRLVDLTTFENLLQASVERGVQIDPTLLEGLFENIDLGIDVKPEDWQALVDDINKKLAELDLPPIKLDVKTGGVENLDNKIKATADHVAGAAAAFSALGNAMSQIEDPGAKVAGMVSQAIGSVISGYGAATAQAATMGPWAWIAFAATGLATMISTIAGIKEAATGFSDGGMVGGNSYSGDNIVARLNSGEGVLTARGVQNAAIMANGANATNAGASRSFVTGDTIVLGVNNYLGRSGQGEIVTTSMLRRAGINL